MSVRALRRGAIAASRVSAPAAVNTLSLPGDNVAHAYTADSVANSITGDIDIRVKASLTDWTPGTTSMLVSKFDTGVDRAWAISIAASTGNPTFWKSTTGANELNVAVSAPGWTDGSAQWLRVTSATASGTTKFYSSSDGSTWTQFGGDQTITTGAFFDSAAFMTIGNFLFNGSPFWSMAGNMYYFELRNGIGGTVAAKFDATAVTRLGTRNPGTVVSSTGETWSLVGSGWDWVSV